LSKRALLKNNQLSHSNVYKKMTSAAYRKFLIQLLIISGSILLLMTAYESVKSILFPDITLWKSHFITIIFSAFCGTVSSYFILFNQVKINSILDRKNIENEMLKNELQETVSKLTITLSELKTLQGLLTVCASCRKIKNKDGSWSQLEAYVHEHAEVDFSHGICPECANILYPDIMEKIKKL